LDNSDSHKLLSTVASLLHQTAHKTLNDWARGLAESLLLVPSGSVWQVNSMITLARNVILKKKNNSTVRTTGIENRQSDEG
jgi:hypothetical protein